MCLHFVSLWFAYYVCFCGYIGCAAVCILCVPLSVKCLCVCVCFVCTLCVLL